MGSVNVFNVGFTCFDFDSLTKAETQRCDYPVAYMPDTYWTAFMQRKFVRISAPMGAGKT
jgi:hypothetical protein